MLGIDLLDLQLAAELGKTLLERNVDLEGQLRTVRQLYAEQTTEIDVCLLLYFVHVVMIIIKNALHLENLYCLTN